MSNIKLYLIKFAVLECGKIGIAEVAAESAKKAQEILQANGKYNGYKYAMEYPELVHTTDTFTAEALISELDNPAGEKGDRGPQGLKGEKGEKGEKGDPGVDPKGYYPDMSVGMADNLVGRGDVQNAKINFRPSAGADNITDGAARIERIKGNSVVYNQLVVSSDDWLNSYLRTKITIEDIGNYTTTVTTKIEATGDQIGTYVCGESFVNAVGHKYLLLGSFNNQKGTIGIKFGNKYFNKTLPCILDNDGGVSSSFAVHPFGLGGSTLPAGEVATLSKISLIDLTKEFGEAIANEIASASDAIAKYNERKPMNIEDEFDYNAGTLVDMKVNSLISTSDNAYDYTKGYARVMGCVPYTITVDNRNDITPEEVYFSKTLPVTTYEENIIVPNADGTYTFPSNGYAKASFQGYEVGKEDTICICLKHSYDKPHPAYQQEVKDLSWIWKITDGNGELLFPEGMRSAGSAFDEIRFNPTTKKWEAVKRIGVAKNLTFISGGENFFVVSIADSKWPETYEERAKTIFSNKYAVSKNVAASSMDDKSMLQLPQKNNIYIKDSAYATVAAFNEANKDLVIYYELAEPVVVELDYPTAETNMDYLVWDFGTEEAIVPNNAPSAPFRADIQYADNFVDDIRGNKEAIATNKTAIAKNTADIKTKQNALTLTTKPNGNIVIGNLAGQSKEFMPATPSGDPMHYMYKEVGAVYNDTGADITMTGKYGNTYLHKSGYWRLNEIGDIPNSEMRKIYEKAYHIGATNYLLGWFSSSGGRTNACMCGWSATYSMANIFVNNGTVEIASLSSGNNASPKEMNYAFAYCTKLHTIITTINMKYTSSYSTAFTSCSALSNIRLINLGVNVFFPDSPLLSKESLLYMIDNCASNATFTITLHPDVYTKCVESGEWEEAVHAAEMNADIHKNTFITLASA